MNKEEVEVYSTTPNFGSALGEWPAASCFPGDIAPKHSLDRNLGGFQNRSGLCGERKFLANIVKRSQLSTMHPSRYTDCAILAVQGLNWISEDKWEDKNISI
jgi:hypothetical protein